MLHCRAWQWEVQDRKPPNLQTVAMLTELRNEGRTAVFAVSCGPGWPLIHTRRPPNLLLLTLTKRGGPPKKQPCTEGACCSRRRLRKSCRSDCKQQKLAGNAALTLLAALQALALCLQDGTTVLAVLWALAACLHDGTSVLAV